MTVVTSKFGFLSIYTTQLLSRISVAFRLRSLQSQKDFATDGPKGWSISVMILLYCSMNKRNSYNNAL